MKILIKIISLFLLFLITRGLSAQVYWNPVPSPTSAQLYRCEFTDTLNGWACGDSGTVVHTSDGGLNWSKQATNINYFIDDISFSNERLGWGIATDYIYYKSYVLKTTNGGTVWNSFQYPDTTVILSTVYFLDSLNGYMGGFNGVILKTTNAGAVWNQMPVDSSLYSHFHIKNFRFYNSTYGAACGGIMDFGGVLWITTNSGFNWHTITIAPEPIYDVVYLDSAKALATGGDFEYGASFVKTYSGWSNWDYNALFYFGVGQAVAMRTRTEIWVPLAFSFSWAVSLDTGNTWQMITNPDSNAIYDAVFIDSTHGWAVGNDGRIYKYNPEIIGIGNNKKTVESYLLFQNFPNPFNPATTIYYNLPAAEHVKLSVYDILGREVAELINENQQSGKHNAVWNASSFPSGVYFYKLSAGEYSKTRKMVLLK
jgi:photosystem II stability/assembly factor-like uncharacterized protein